MLTCQCSVSNIAFDFSHLRFNAQFSSVLPMCSLILPVLNNYVQHCDTVQNMYMNKTNKLKEGEKKTTLITVL